jgi:transcriptional regulator with XRE-family HTH domain
MTEQTTPPTPGARLTAARLAKGWSQPELSRQAFGTAARQPNIVTWERGQMGMSYPTARKLAAALGVTVQWLLEGK